MSLASQEGQLGARRSRTSATAMPDDFASMTAVTCNSAGTQLLNECMESFIWPQHASLGPLVGTLEMQQVVVSSRCDCYVHVGLIVPQGPRDLESILPPTLNEQELHHTPWFDPQVCSEAFQPLSDAIPRTDTKRLWSSSSRRSLLWGNVKASECKGGVMKH